MKKNISLKLVNKGHVVAFGHPKRARVVGMIDRRKQPNNKEAGATKLCTGVPARLTSCVLLFTVSNKSKLNNFSAKQVIDYISKNRKMHHT